MAADDVSENGYKVGFGKPPLERRFRPGQSGNPKGRAKGTKNLRTLLEEELHRSVKVKEDGKARQLTLGQVIAKRVTTQAAGGNLRAAEILLRLTSASTSNPEEDRPIQSELDRDILERALARRMASKKGGLDDG
jgi:hypothetical protein